MEEGEGGGDRVSCTLSFILPRVKQQGGNRKQRSAPK